ncbi:hypothetical protein EQW78_06065 [Oerskovia turbata]|uniref:Uncharacterized protein n=1 Tax=Oerskovia turbata TaxID=1713 RepID=A0A4Q1KZZ9_9CELL|nr:hypothetical protein [Oerskovia turbata]RXR25023.1 hypothetical protein EQW73_12095 [Oerskovia turbata]RXR35169.1 hypothetical protein EQW78_06065 [Oerskovia turbata]TGJ96413.1 hypothetical protein DLJ96_11950 [Actinotalea fermentans ATCC 43279 = JCM 9966 = DSM 3133]
MSTTDHGPSNHGDDLGRALRDLVDDASLPGLDAHLDVVRGRTRRRRAAKKVALGATTLCVAGVLGVAAVSLPQDARPEPVAPADTPSPTPAPLPTFPAGIDAAALTCRQPAPVPTGDDLPALLSTDVPDLTVRTSSTVTAPVTVAFGDDARLRYDDTAAGAYVIAQGGVIVSTSLPVAQTTGEATPAPGSATTWEIGVAAVAACDPAGTQPTPLPAGAYEVFALHRLPLTGYSVLQPDGTWGDETTGKLFDGWLVADPVPLTITSEPDPVVVRDVLSTDTSPVFEALREAAAAGAPAAVDLFVGEVPHPLTEGPDGTLTVRVARNDDVGERSRTTSDDGWELVVHGGRKFIDHPEDAQSFARLVGTYSVTLDDSGGTPTLVLQVVDGPTPTEPPASTDEAVCAAHFDSLNGVEGASSATVSAWEEDVLALYDATEPAATSSVYPEIRSRWIDSPRVWWAAVTTADVMRTTGFGGDALVGACSVFWDH